ncbi:hypothetical protein [Magnetofaba australis]|uniref:Uncharacterized protein n=1 Tax=Magnetofaba australis IT-1 TaxID=1434232 RepID=A0A1Y2K6J3_9PROT|nr:hypothetical protein [Magnetofaba australis]OSM05272.1 hypothetical protein MAIT1_03439 [Magnetofaba australis IT-1]
MSTLEEKVLEKHLQECLQQICPLFKEVRERQGGKLPEELLDDAYVMGYVKGMANMLLARQHVEDDNERGYAIILIFAKVFEKDPRMVGERLAILHADRSNIDYLEGITDGEDRLMGLNDGRRDEVTYRLMHRLEPYMKLEA